MHDDLFPHHTHDTAPAGSLAAFAAAEQQFHSVPNLLRKMATSPALASAYLSLSDLFERSSLTSSERQVVLLAVSRYHECRYCMAAHSVLADMAGVPAPVVKALREDQPIPDARLEALRQFTTLVVDRRGAVDPADVGRFLAAGYAADDVLNVILGIGLKTLSNYTNHITGTGLDVAFEHRAWAPGA